MVKLLDIRQKFTNIKEQVESKVFDPYLLKYIEVPVIDEDKLLILISIMERLELSYNEIKNYAATTMLIQIALDTHEHISNTEIEEKCRQLTVLAGDYYSGLYYKLLADSEDIRMIKELSKGIKEINENKIFTYQNEFESVKELMNCMMKVEGSLIFKFSEFFKVELWNEYIGNLLLLKRLLVEKKQFLHTQTSILFESMKRIMYPNLKTLTEKQQQDLLVICDRYIETSRQYLLKGISQLPYLNNLLEDRIHSIIKEHQPNAKTLVEEG